ncbi:MAG TPA: ABC transporter ATP-binding protein [Capillimicrobium sp.]|nr:ABC transporter ATP-binding protein [Capillimicrobium sp.]
MSAVLELQELDAGHGGVPVVRGLSLSVGEGEVAALLGANGAGKTTTLATAAGLLRPLGGGVALDGRAVGGLRADRAARLGLALVPDDRGVFGGLTVREHLRMGPRRDRARRLADAWALFPALEPLAGRRAGLLSGGEQQMLALARVLVRRPRVLMVDELSLGLAPRIAADILAALRRLADERGTAVLIVEQHVPLALGVADRAFVLRRGELALSGSAAEVAQRRDVLEASYLGEAA